MKRIGIVMPAIINPLHSDMIKGVCKAAFENKFDVVVITNTTNPYEHFSYNDYTFGEENIFSLIECIHLDGIIFASHFFNKKALEMKIAEHIRKSGIPCIDTGGTEYGFRTFRIEQSRIFHDITAHVIVEHGCRNIICLTGTEGSPDAEERLAGFIKAAQEHNIKYRVVYGDFWRVKANELGLSIASGKIERPDAVVCANDIMAVTLCDTLKVKGISVPKDIIVTGFDAHIEALSHFPSITTIGGQNIEIGRIAAELLIFNDREQNSMQFNSHLKIIYGASCGCMNLHDDYRQAAVQVQDYVKSEQKKTELLDMQTTANFIAKMSDVDDLDALIDAADTSAHILTGFQGIDLCLCDDWVGDFRNPEEYRSEGYSSKMYLALSKRIGYSNESKINFNIQDIVPALKKEHEPALLYLFPLHYSRRVLGYSAVSYECSSDFMIYPLFVSWHDAFANGLRTLQKKWYTDYLKSQIDEASLYDSMTDLLSKKGLKKFLESLPLDSCNYGMILITIGRLLAIPGVLDESSFLDGVMKTELLLAGALRLMSSSEIRIARINEKSFVVVFKLTEDIHMKSYSDQFVIKLNVLMKKMKENTSCSFYPDIIYDSCIISDINICETLEERMEILSEKANYPIDKKTIDISQLIQLNREMHQSPQLKWNQATIAKKLNISISYLQKLYKKMFDISFMDDLIQSRMDKAIMLLKTTDLRVNEISEQCGYQNQTHFMRQFKSKFNITPSAYRKKNGEK